MRMILPDSSPKAFATPPPFNHNERCPNAILDSCDTKRRKGDDELPVRDRISHLPDDLLHKILSNLPTKDAVATSVLSKRWRLAFTWVTRLDFDTRPISHCRSYRHMTCSFPRFLRFVDNVLQACQSQLTTSFRLHITNSKSIPHSYYHYLDDQNCLPTMDPDRLYAWMCFPLTRGVTQLDICASVKISGKLPSALYTCRTLEIMKLSGTFHLQPPSSICLPNLKHLHLFLINIPDDDSVSRLVSSCPSLEDLFFKGLFLLSTPLSISSPSLRRLTVNNKNVDFVPRSKLTLDVPNVEYLVYQDMSALEYSIGTLNSLVEAEVHTMFEDETNVDHIISFVNPLSNAQRLFLKYGCVEFLDYSTVNHKLPVFRNLNRLELGCFGFYYWHKVLMDLLVCTPVLETLVFPEGILRETDTDEHMEVSETECRSWSTSIQTIPTCVGFHFKRILIEQYQLTEWELSMVKYFLKNASVLEELMVVCNTSVPLVDRISHDTALQKLPRGSMTCSIKVQ